MLDTIFFSRILQYKRFMILSPAFTSSYTPIWYITLILWILTELYLMYRDRNTTKQQDRGSRRKIGIAIIAGIALS